MRWSIVLCLGAALALCGCRSSCDKVEAELRARETDVHTLRSELDREQLTNQLLIQELASLHGTPGCDGAARRVSEPYPVQSLVLGRQTAGRPDDKLGGDDALQVQVEPRDTEGQAIKAPGTVHVEAFEVSPEGIKALLSTWTVSREELRTKWQSGLFSTGYLLTFPWKVPPVTDKMRVVVRFQMLNGRLLEADKDITIRVLPGAREKRKLLPPPTGAAPLPAPLPPVAETPPPPETKAEDKKPEDKKPEEKKPEEKKVLPPPAPEQGPDLSHAGPPGPVRMLKPVPLVGGSTAPIVHD